MSYRDDWTTDRLPLWLPYIKHLIGRANVNILEIGAYEGRSTVWMLEKILTHPTSLIVCLDPFCPNPTFMISGDYLPRFAENTEPYRGKVRIVQSLSQDLLPGTLLDFVCNRYDLIYVDGSHEMDDAFRDARLAMLVSKPGTIIVFDDYEWKDVRFAVDQWLNEMGERIEVLMCGYQVMVRVK